MVTHSVSTCYKFPVTACKLELTLVVWGWVSPRINSKPKEANEGLRQQEPTNAQQRIQEDGTEDASPRADVERILVSTACYFLPLLFFTCRELLKGCPSILLDVQCRPDLCRHAIELEIFAECAVNLCILL
jgi:hypothetical protein